MIRFQAKDVIYLHYEYLIQAQGYGNEATGLCGALGTGELQSKLEL